MKSKAEGGLKKKGEEDTLERPWAGEKAIIDSPIVVNLFLQLKAEVGGFEEPSGKSQGDRQEEESCICHSKLTFKHDGEQETEDIKGETKSRSRKRKKRVGKGRQIDRLPKRGKSLLITVRAPPNHTGGGGCGKSSEPLTVPRRRVYSLFEGYESTKSVRERMD